VTSFAEEVAREAGEELRRRFDSGQRRGVSSKSTPTDLVSEADLAAEALIRARLQATCPDDAIVGEEDADRAGTSGRRWIVDPLDGTVNFLFGIPQWSVSIALEDGDGMKCGVVYDAMRDECWSAVRGGPPLLNGHEVAASGREEMATAMVATGFGYDSRVREVQAEVVAKLLPRVRDIRRFGSAALDLAWTAGGRYDAYYERGVKLWDVAAGQLLCERAGLVARRLEPAPPADAGLLVAPSAFVDELFGFVS
jgi:myo-inositol-1(or 4)-monophosphatase